MFPVVQ